MAHYQNSKISIRRPQEKDSFISIKESTKSKIIDSIDDNINNNGNIEYNIDKNIILESNYSSKSNKIKYPIPTLQSCNIVMKALARTGDLKNVKIFFNSLKSKYGFHPDGFSWFNLIQAAVTGNKMTESMNILDDFLLSRREGTDADSISPNHIFNHLISAFQKNGDYDIVQELYEKMLLNKMEPNIYTYTTLITAAYENNQADLADKYYQKILDKRLIITHQSWRVLIAPLSNKSDYIGLEHIMNRMRLHGSIPYVSMWRDLIGIYGKLGLCQLCLNSLEIMEKKDNIKPDFGCYIRVIRAYSESENNWEIGLLLLRKARELKLIVNPIAWQYVIEACVNSTHSNQMYNNSNDKNNNSNNKNSSNNDDNNNNSNNNNNNNNNNNDNNNNNNNNRNKKKNTRISCVFALLNEMQTVDKFLPDSYLWNTIVEAFGMKVHSPLINNNYDDYNYHDNNQENINNLSYSYTREEKETLFKDNNLRYFSYFYGDHDEGRLPEEISLLKKFLLICSDRNQENLFSELLRPLLRVSSSVGTSVPYPYHFILLNFIPIHDIMS